MLDPNPHYRQNSGASEAQMEPLRAVDAHNGGVGAKKEAQSWYF
jgi:hypothetical protein